MNLHMIQMTLQRPPLMRFARAHDLLAARADDPGYLLHAWLSAMFGPRAPKPFYFLQKRTQLFGYAANDAASLLEHANAFADPLAHAALASDGLASKEMPRQWSAGRQLRLHVRACPIARKGAEEKDVFLRAVERWTEAGQATDTKPDRGTVYCTWMARQVIGRGIDIERITLNGYRARVVMQRRSRSAVNTGLKYVERPEAEFEMLARITDPDCFNELLGRGVGRHRAFGFGMVRLLPV